MCVLYKKKVYISLANFLKSPVVLNFLHTPHMKTEAVTKIIAPVISDIPRLVGTADEKALLESPVPVPLVLPLRLGIDVLELVLERDGLLVELLESEVSVLDEDVGLVVEEDPLLLLPLLGEADPSVDWFGSSVAVGEGVCWVVAVVDEDPGELEPADLGAALSAGSFFC